MTVSPDSDIFFTGQENGYTLTIPDTEPSRVQTSLPTLPSGVQFVSSKRDEFIDSSGKRGTQVRLWFSFTDTGTVRLPPLNVQIGLRTYRIPFAPVVVYENPALISPLMEIDFSDGENIAFSSRNSVPQLTLSAGTPVVFTVSLKYFVQIVQFSWKLPKDSIFKEIERYEISGNSSRGSGFSPDSVPVAKFEWTPLMPGTYSLPEINLSATAYNGSRRMVSVPKYQIVVVESDKNDEIPDSSAESVFSSAFYQKETSAVSETQLNISREDCARIAELRSAERNSFPWSSASAERVKFEHSLGIAYSASEQSGPLFFIFIVIAVIFILFGVLFLLKRRIKRSVAFFCASAFFIIIFLTGMVRLSAEYGIFAGGKIRSVPEEKTSSIHFVSSGLRVRIIERAGEWIYIESPDAVGWVSVTEVFAIK